MNATNPTASSRTDRRQTRLVIVRANAPLFYSTVIASFLETDAAQATTRLVECCGADQRLSDWLHGQWLPLKNAHAQALRQYVERCWPEFDWAAAYEHYRAALVQNAAVAYRTTAGHAALAGCVGAAQAGIYYRALARWSDDHALRALASAMAEEEAAAFGCFREGFDRCARRERLGIVGSWRTARSCARFARDRYVRLAFDALRATGGFNAPFPILTYPEFLARMRPVISRCASPMWVERVIFSPWTRTPRIESEARPRPAALSWFRPVLAKAA